MDINTATDREIVEAMMGDTLLNRVRKIIAESAGEIDQACRQRRMPSPVEIRRMEFRAAQRAIAEVDTERRRPLSSTFSEDGFSGDFSGLRPIDGKEG